MKSARYSVPLFGMVCHSSDETQGETFSLSGSASRRAATKQVISSEVIQPRVS